MRSLIYISEDIDGREGFTAAEEELFDVWLLLLAEARSRRDG